MKATELRIGNVIFDPKRKDVNLDGFGNGFYRVSSWAIERHDLGYLELQPVPLSEEWLLRTGCIPDGKSEGLVNYWNQEYDFSVYVETVLSDNGVQKLFFYKVSNNRSKHLMYIHQLQNLHFALKGEELTF